MKNLLSILGYSFFFFSCEEVTQLDLSANEPRLVIEAVLINQLKALDNPPHPDIPEVSPGNENFIVLDDPTKQEIKLSMTVPYASTKRIAVTSAKISVTNTNSGIVYTFAHTNKGTYTTSGFIFSPGENYQLNVSYNGEMYQAETSYTITPNILAIEQSLENGLSKNLKEIIAYFLDPPDEQDIYIWRAHTTGRIDELFRFSPPKGKGNGALLPLSYEPKKALVIGDTVTYSLRSLTLDQSAFYSKMIEQLSHSPFSSPKSELRGNISNLSDQENYPYGQFTVVQESIGQIKIK